MCIIAVDIIIGITIIIMGISINSSSPRQNGRHFTDDIFKRNYLNKKFRFLTKISLKFPKGPIDNNQALV